MPFVRNYGEAMIMLGMDFNTSDYGGVFGKRCTHKRSYGEIDGNGGFRAGTMVNVVVFCLEDHMNT